MAAVFSKRDVKLASLLKRGTTTIAGSVGIDEVATDWLYGALRQADFLICALRDSTLCEEPTFDSLCAKKRHP